VGLIPVRINPCENCGHYDDATGKYSPYCMSCEEYRENEKEGDENNI
jgi:hypothetical protein